MMGAGRPSSPKRNLWLALAAALVAALLAACSMEMVASGRLGFAETTVDGGPICASALGSYSLPRANLHLRVGLVPGSANAVVVPDILVLHDTDPSVDVTLHPDPSLVFCVDYLASALADDIITIKKAPAPNMSFLGAVTINATDQTVYVIETLLRAGFIIASGSGGFAPRATVIGTATNAQILADLEYDPFNPDESAETNATLSRLGFCLVLENFTFDRRIGVDRYCNSPARYGSRPTLITKAYVKAEATPADPHFPGLLYRPRVPYQLEIYHKADPNGPGPWRLYEMDSVSLENLSPVLSLDIRRAAFAGRNANFVFDRGALSIACVSKASELLAASEIPLQIAKSIVALPGAIVSVRLDQIGNQKKLVDAQTQLLQVQNSYLAALSGKSFQPNSNVAAPDYSKIPGFSTTPTDIKQRDPAAAYGTDLFSNNLATICSPS